MNESANSSEPSSSTVNTNKSSMPYEAALNKALDKLTSEIFIFLIAYMILVIGLASLGQGIPDNLQTLIYIIPIVGVVAYGWSRKRTVKKDPNASGVRVKSLFQKGGYIGGVRGPANTDFDKVNVSGGVTLDGTLVGIDQGGRQISNDSQYLLGIFEELDENDQDAIIQYALKRKARSQ